MSRYKSKFRQCLTLIFLMLSTRATSIEPLQELFIIWDVGQGSFASYINETQCHHIDAGGNKKIPLKIVKYFCNKKKNYMYLTHFDRDHTNQIYKLKYALKNLCMVLLPNHKWASSIATCAPPKGGPSHLYTSQFKVRNESHVFSIKRQILITGDNPKKIEALIPSNKLKHIRFLVIGHHGSKTSTSHKFIQSMPHLKGAIASAKKKTYGHPHPKTVQTLHEFFIGLMTTEDYGHIMISL